MVNAAKTCHITLVVTTNTEGKEATMAGEIEMVSDVILSQSAVIGDGTDCEEEYVVPLNVQWKSHPV